MKTNYIITSNSTTTPHEQRTGKTLAVVDITLKQI